MIIILTYNVSDFDWDEATRDVEDLSRDENTDSTKVNAWVTGIIDRRS